MNAPLVGVLGASGAVGRAAVRTLPTLGRPVRLRVGARRPGRHEGIDVHPVDATDPAALARFCAGCAVVLNCAGPSAHLTERVARAALSAGAAYADVGGDDRTLAALADAGGTVVLGAGLQPGLSALLPRWLAGRLDSAHKLIGFAGGLEPVTPAAAADYLISLDGGHGTALAAWRRGRRTERALRPLVDVELPDFPGRVSAHPFLATETERLAVALGLAEADWYVVVAGEQLRPLLSALRERQWSRATATELAAATRRVAVAAAVDLAGRRPYHRMVVRVEGVDGGRPRTAAAVLDTPDSFQVTGVVGALAARTLLDGRVPPGTWFAADVLDPGEVVEALRGCGAATVGCGSAVEEGVL